MLNTQLRRDMRRLYMTGLCAGVLLVSLSGAGCNRERSGETSDVVDVERLLEPPEHAAGEPHPFDDCPDGACPRTEPAYLFSGEFHEAVVDLRVSSCGVGLDLVWARRYRSRLPLAADQTPQLIAIVFVRMEPPFFQDTETFADLGAWVEASQGRCVAAIEEVVRAGISDGTFRSSLNPRPVTPPRSSPRTLPKQQRPCGLASLEFC